MKDEELQELGEEDLYREKYWCSNANPQLGEKKEDFPSNHGK